MGFRAFVEGKSPICSTSGLGSRCKLVGENTEMGGSCGDEVFDRWVLSTESTLLFDPCRSATPLIEYAWWVWAILSHFLIVARRRSSGSVA